MAGAGAGTVEFRLYGPNDANCTGGSILPNPIVVPLTLTGATTGTATSTPAFTPTVAGTYRWRAFYSGDANNDPANGPCNAPNESTIVRAQPLIPTTASGTVSVGGSLTDVANVTGLVDPVVGAGAGTVEFRLYGPSDPNCTAGSILPNPIVVPLTLTSPTAGTATSSPAFTPTVPGVYRWRAFYSGDLRNDPVSGPCNAPNESTRVRAQPLIPTTASADISLGAGTLTDTAQVTGLLDPVIGAGAGTVEFRLYGPTDPNCNAASILPNPIVVPLTLTSATAGTATSTPPYTPTVAGTYHWRAFYSGDANNDPASGPCNAPNENTIVRAQPAIATTASGDISLGVGTLSDIANVTGLVAPVAGATVEFRLYGPGDTNCTAGSILPNPIVVPLTLTSATTGTATSTPPYTPTVAGTYRWRAFYSGDIHNDAISGPCNAANENTVVRAGPAITTQASADITLGGALIDNATVSGLVDAVPGAGTVEFRLYGPDDANCTGGSILPAPMVIPLTLNASLTGGTASVTPAFTPTAPGTYR